MADYLILAPIIRQAEGGRNSHSEDRAASMAGNADAPQGVHTNRGIQWQTFKWWAPRLGFGIDAGLYLQMPDNVWNAIFKAGYWDAVRADEIKSQELANYLVDYAFQSGPPRAAMDLQRSLNEVLGTGLQVDGVVGPITLAAVARAEQRKLTQKVLDELHERRYTFYSQLFSGHPWLGGVLRRISELYEAQKKTS